MSYAKKRAEGKTPKDVYAEIRKETTEEALRTGEYWIVVSASIPMFKTTTAECKNLTKWLYDNTTKEERDRIHFKNILTGAEVSVEEMHEYRKIGEKSR